jgi:hypothetical protein
MIRYFNGSGPIYKQTKESNVLLSRCAQQLAVKVKYPSLFWVMSGFFD